MKKFSLFQKSNWFCGILHFDSAEEVAQNLRSCFPVNQKTVVFCSDDLEYGTLTNIHEAKTFEEMAPEGFPMEIETKEGTAFLWVQKNISNLTNGSLVYESTEPISDK